MGLFSLSDLEYMFWAAIRNGSIGTIGAKGDPGGIVNGPALTNVSLDTLTETGTYRANDPALATLANNYPVAGKTGNVLTLQGVHAGWVTQEFRLIDGQAGPEQVFYRRNRSNSVWSPWKAYSSTRVDQTAGRAIYAWDNVNNREQLVYGDTGARSIGDLLINGWATTASNVLLSRQNNTVNFSAQLTSMAATDAVLYTLPVGFRPKTSNAHPINAQVSEGPYKWAYARWTGDIKIDIASTNASIFVSGSWYTTDAWPTVLPGAANGTIPNL